MSTAHNSKARAAAAALKPVDRNTLPHARSGRRCWDPETQSTGWLPVTGPHLRAVHAKHKGNRTGVPGISYGVNRFPRKDGTVRVRRYFFSQIGPTCRKFCLDTLGKAEAWRRALACRAAYERQINSVNALILKAREKNEYS